MDSLEQFGEELTNLVNHYSNLLTTLEILGILDIVRGSYFDLVKENFRLERREGEIVENEVEQKGACKFPRSVGNSDDPQGRC